MASSPPIRLLDHINLVRSYLAELGRAEDWQEIQEAVAPLLADGSTEIAEWQAATDPLWHRGTTLILHDVESRVGAIDLESKFTEAAVGNLQIADYRNFAHGRHHCCEARQDSAVLALHSPAGRDLAERTLALLPKEVPVARLALNAPPLGVMLASLIAALRITGWAGVARGVDPGRPGVPEFGRKLYHLPLPRNSAARFPGLSARHEAALPQGCIAVAQLAQSGELQRCRRPWRFPRAAARASLIDRPRL